MQLTPVQCQRDADASPAFGAGRKLSDVAQALWWTFLQEEPQGPSRALLDEAARRHRRLAVSLRHVHRWRASRGRKRHPGRPRQAAGQQPVPSGAAGVHGTPPLSCVGGHVLARGLAQHEACGAVVARLTQAIEAPTQRHPGAAFALVPHRESTLRRRFAALCLAPVVGIERLRACDSRAHGLESLRGRGSPSATRHPCLGQLERVAAERALLATRVPQEPGQLA